MHSYMLPSSPILPDGSLPSPPSTPSQSIHPKETKFTGLASSKSTSYKRSKPDHNRSHSASPGEHLTKLAPEHSYESNPPVPRLATPPPSPLKPVSSKGTGSLRSTLSKVVLFFNLFNPTKLGPSLPKPVSPRPKHTKPARRHSHELGFQDVVAEIAAPTISSDAGSVASQHRTRAAARRAKGVFRLIEGVRDGRVTRNRFLIRRKLLGTEYKQLLGLIEDNDEVSGFVEDKLRFDYIYAQEELTIQMPGWIHETVSNSIASKVLKWLAHIELGVIPSDKDTITVASGIRNVGSPDINFPGAVGKMSADQSFKYLKGFPELVIEVAWSQRPLKLAERAEHYIKWSHGKIQTVVGLNLYNVWSDQRKRQPRDQSAKFSVWRAEINESTGEAKVSSSKSIVDQIFRQQDGKPADSVELRLGLKDFVREADAKSLDINELELGITSAELCAYFDTALQDHLENIEAKQSVDAVTHQDATAPSHGSGQMGSIRRVIEGVRLRRSARVARKPGG